jgi:hypothetical protein
VSEAIEPAAVDERHLGVKEIAYAKAPVPKILRGVPGHPRMPDLEALTTKHVEVCLVGAPAFGHLGSTLPWLEGA